MRIRKNVNVSEIYAAASTPLQPTLCTLSRDPWDVMDFSQFLDSLSQPPSPMAPPSQTRSEGFAIGNEDPPVAKQIINGDKGKNERPGKYKVRKMCIKKRGKRWKCRSKVVEGKVLCEHHLSLEESRISRRQRKKEKLEEEKKKSVVVEPQQQHNKRKRSTTSTFSTSDYESTDYYYDSSYDGSTREEEE